MQSLGKRISVIRLGQQEDQQIETTPTSIFKNIRIVFVISLGKGSDDTVDLLAFFGQFKCFQKISERLVDRHAREIKL